MTTAVETEGVEPRADYQYIDDGDHNYLRLKRQQQANTDHSRHNESNIQAVRIESGAGTDNKASPKRPPWWVWVLMVLCMVIIVGLAAVLFYVTKGFPKQNTTKSSNGGLAIGSSCQTLYNAGVTTSGVHTVSPDGVRQMTVYCEQSLDGGGWTVLLSRRDGHVDFNRNWSEYKYGFGDATGEHWLGNENIYLLTAAGNQKLKIHMRHPNGTYAFADYTVFWIENESKNYRLHVAGFLIRHPPGDALSSHNAAEFTTLDRDNDAHAEANCGDVHDGGWWFTGCYQSHLTGLYNGRGAKFRGIVWYPFTSPTQSLINVRMMVKTA